MTNTYKFTQIHTNTHKYRHTQIHTNTYKSILTQLGECTLFTFITVLTSDTVVHVWGRLRTYTVVYGVVYEAVCGRTELSTGRPSMGSFVYVVIYAVVYGVVYGVVHLREPSTRSSTGLSLYAVVYGVVRLRGCLRGRLSMWSSTRSSVYGVVHLRPSHN